MIEERAFAAINRILAREWDVGDTTSGNVQMIAARADKIRCLAPRIGPDDLEVVGGLDAFVTDARRYHNHVAGTHIEDFPILAAEHQLGGSARDAEDFMIQGMEMVIWIDPPTPHGPPIVSNEAVLEPVRRVFG